MPDGIYRLRKACIEQEQGKPNAILQEMQRKPENALVSFLVATDGTPQEALALLHDAITGLDYAIKHA